MYVIGFTMLVVGILTFAVGMTLIVMSVGSPFMDSLVAKPAVAEEVTPESEPEVEPEVAPEPEAYYEPGTLVMVEDKAYIADTATVPGFMFTMWKAQMVQTGVKILHEQDMGNGLMTVAALVPQEPGACGHEECQPGYEAPENNEGDGTNGMYL